MIDIQTISIIVGIFIGVGTIIAGSGFAYAQFKSGGDKAKDDLIDTLQKALQVEKDNNTELVKKNTELITSHQTQLTDLNKALGVLQGRFDEQSKKVEEYKTILQGKDPSQVAYMETMSKGLKTALEYINDSQPIMIKMDKFLEKNK